MRDYDVVVIGELNPDLILTGDNVVPDFSQVENLVDDATLALGSSSAIFACGASRLGLRVAFIGKVGKDEFGRFVLRVLDSRGVDRSAVIVDSSAKTGLTVHLSHRTDRAMLTYPGAIAALHGADIDRRLLAHSRHLHVGSFFLQSGIHADLPGVFAAAHATGASVSLDPGWDPARQWDSALKSALAMVDIFLPNEQEAAAIAGKDTIREALAALARQLPLVVVKLGAEGACAQRGTRQVWQPGYPVQAIDTTGAGDTFDAGFIYGHLAALSLEESLRWACACGALATTRIGGIEGQPTREEVVQMLAAQVS